MYNCFVNGESVKNISQIEWADDLNTYANTFSFPCDSLFETGSIFELKTAATDEMVLKGIITDFEQNRANLFNYSGFDCGFYINQNEVIEQFRNAQVSDALKKLCSTYKIPAGNIPNISTRISQIFKDKRLSDVFDELLKLAHDKGGLKDAYYTCARGKFEILKYEERKFLTGYMADVFSTESANTISSPSIKVSMQELRNRVLIADNDKENIKAYKAEDTKSISKYGLLQEVETVDTSKTNNLSKIAADKLKELNVLKRSIDLTMLGDYRMHKGIIMPVTREDFGIDGKFLIKSSRHLIKGTTENVSVSLVMRD